jgi:hypothetical protein
LETLTESAAAIALARRRIIDRLGQIAASGEPYPSPRKLVDDLAAGKNGDPYRAAITSLIASGRIELTPTWRLRLPSGNGASHG